MIETKKSFCRFCHVFCGMEVDVDVEKNRVLAVRGDPDNAVSGGYTCLKGRAEVERLYHPDRLLSSKKRVGELCIDIAAETALDEIGAKLRAIIDQHGPRSVAVYVGDAGHRMSAAGPWFMRKWLDALGSPGLYTSYTVDSPSLSIAGHRFFGAPVPLGVFDIDHADVAMLIATNPVVSHLFSIPQSNPSKRLRNAQTRGMKLIVIDPRRCDVARQADIHLQVKPGEDPTLLAGIIKIILDRKLYDREYVEKYVSGLNELHEAVKDFDLDYVSRRTQVPADLIVKAAVMFATAKRGAAQSGTGLAMATHQNLACQLVPTLNALCGRYDRQGGLTRNPGVLSPPLPENPQPIPMPLFPGPEARIRGLKGISNWLGVLEMPSNTLADEILQPGEGQIRALIVNGGNPVLVFPDEEATVRAMKSVDLLVVTDLFMSATAKFAHYVLATKHPFERSDVPKLMDPLFPIPFSQYTPALVRASGDLMEEWEIFWGLAHRLGIRLDIPGISMEHKPTAYQMLEGLTAGSRIPLSEVRKYPGGHVFGAPEVSVGGIIPNMIGHADHKMAAGHPEVIAELREVRAEPVFDNGGYEPTESFAYRMITYRMPEVYCTQGQNLPSLRKKKSYNPVLMNPQDVDALHVKDGDTVVVDSGYGTVEGIVEGTADLARGVIALAHGWGDPSDSGELRDTGSNVQRLIPDDQRFNALTGLALMSAVPVNVHPAASAR